MRPYDTELASGEASDGFDTPNFPPHIQAAIDAGQNKSWNGTMMIYETPTEFASRIAGMVAEECAKIAMKVRIQDALRGIAFTTYDAKEIAREIRAAFGLGEKP